MLGLLLSPKGTIQFEIERGAESRLEPWTVPADADEEGPYLVTPAELREQGGPTALCSLALELLITDLGEARRGAMR